jgi:PAS domain S-box-containing protein
LELFRCAPAEIIGKTGLAFSPLYQADGRESAVVFAEAFDGASRGVKDLDWRYQRTDGSLLDTETTIAWVTLAGHPHIITFIRDITASRMAAQALKRSEQRFRTIFENAAVGIAIADNSGRYVQFNDRFREMLGYSAKELGALTNSDVTHPEDVPRSKENLARVIRGECHSYQMEKRFLRKSGEAFWAFLSVGAVRHVASDVPLAVGVVVDINEGKSMQEGQKRLEKHMLQSQKAEALGTMAGGIAHDFNNILFGILGYTEMALSDIDPHHAAREYLDSVREAALRSRELVQQILAFSRQAEASPEAIQPRIIVKEVLTLLRASLPSTIQIYTLMPSEAFIHGDPGQLHQVIMNLCTNAGHAMEEAGGRLSIGLHDREVDSLQAEPCPGVAPGKYVQLTVADTGKGIPSAIQEKIFDPYFTTKPKGKGTGMGLAMVQGIVRQMGGAVSVGSQEGAGTTFKVLLPVIEHHGTAAPQEVAVPRKGSGRILFVDDEEILYHLGDRLLQRLGYKVTAFQDSHEALLAFSACPGDFDLVITDLTMPRMNGLQLTERIKAIRPEIPVILATGYSEALTESRARHMGVQCILRKPVTMMELSKHVSQALPGNRDGRSEEGTPE